MFVSRGVVSGSWSVVYWVGTDGSWNECMNGDFGSDVNCGSVVVVFSVVIRGNLLDSIEP